MDVERSPSFGELLRQFRRTAGLTQEELAERAGLRMRGISDLEQGVKLRPRPETIGLLANALGLAAAQRQHLEAARRRSPPASPGPTTPTGSDHRPVPPTSLIGRAPELTTLGALLGSPAVRLLTLTGPPGIGKTRLALASAERSQRDFPDGVAFVDLMTIADPALVLTATAHTCGLGDLPGYSLEESMHRSFAVKRFLLILDNFEHVLAAAPRVAALLAAYPALTVLTTSRARLHLRAEQVFPVPPLSIPDLTAPVDVASLPENPAVALFLGRARAVDPDFALDAENGAVIAEICVGLEGLPLALELAATWVTLLTPEAIRDRLRHPLALLTAGARDLPARQQSLREAITWSYRLLAPSEQALLRQLSVFVGGFSLAAVEAVCSPEAKPGESALAGLATLVDHSLLRQVGDPGAGPRYTILEAIREFSLEQLSRDDRAYDAHARHASYFLALAESAGEEGLGPRAEAWLMRLDQEYGNLRQASTWLAEHGRTEDSLRLAGSLWWYWQARSRFGDARAWLDSLLERPAAGRTRGRARALAAVGASATLQADYASAQTRLSEGLALGREVGDGYVVILALICLGRVAREQGDFPEAHRRLAQAVCVARARADDALTGVALNYQGHLAQDEGDLEQAWHLQEEAVATLRRQSKILVTAPLGAVGELALWRGDCALARRFLEESLVVQGSLAPRRALDNRRDTAVDRCRLGFIELEEGRLERAPVQFRQNLTIYRVVGDQRGIAKTLEGLACVAAAGGQRERAGDLVRAAATLRTAMHALSRPPSTGARAPSRPGLRDHGRERVFRGVRQSGHEPGFRARCIDPSSLASGARVAASHARAGKVRK